MSEHTIKIPIENSTMMLIADCVEVVSGSYVKGYRASEEDGRFEEDVSSIEDAVEAAHPEEHEHVRLSYVANITASLADELKALALGSKTSSFTKVTVEFPGGFVRSYELSDTHSVSLLQGKIVSIQMKDPKHEEMFVVGESPVENLLKSIAILTECAGPGGRAMTAQEYKFIVSTQQNLTS